MTHFKNHDFMRSSVWRHGDPWRHRSQDHSKQYYATSYRSSIEAKPVTRLVFEIFSFENFYVMTSLLTSRGLDQLSVWVFWVHYAVDDYVKRWSNSEKRCRRRSIFKVV